MLFVIIRFALILSLSLFSRLLWGAVPSFSLKITPTSPSSKESFAALSQKEIPFFKDKNSPFPSGYATLETLQQKQVAHELGESYHATQKGLDKSIPLSQLPLISAFHVSRTWITKYTKKRVPANNSLALNEILNLYETDPQDRGLVFTLKETSLREKPHIKSMTLQKVPEFYYLIPISFEKGFVKVVYKKQVGYLDLSESLTKFDFTKLAYPLPTYLNKQKWQFIQNREFEFLLTKEQSLLPINKVMAVIVDEKKVFIYKQNSRFPVWTTFQLVKQKTTPWILSEVSGHGTVWWNDRDEYSYETQNTIDINDLLKRNISSVSMEKTNLQKGIVSADGVFITRDGQTWSEIPQFKNYNGPVYYMTEKIIFVGTYQSVDGGKTFEPYVQVNKLSEAIEDYTGQKPRKIKLKSIKVQKPYKLTLEVDTGIKTLKLRSTLFSQDWTAFK